MRVLIVTGRSMGEKVKEIVRGFDCDVFIADVEIASFMKRNEELQIKPTLRSSK
jgi:hypothetical protein